LAVWFNIFPTNKRDNGYKNASQVSGFVFMFCMLIAWLYGTSFSELMEVSVMY
jgi:hypothetical protein